MDEQKDDPRFERPRRIESLTGSGARRRWSEPLKAQIVAESLTPGTIVAAVARRYRARPSQVHGGRKDAREGLRVPTHPEHPFRTKLNTRSDGT